MLNFWDDRYSDNEYAYGTKPNAYFQRKIDSLTPGSILLPAEGEGRNAVYAAQNGWNVTAFDSSKIGMHKALLLAESMNTKIKYVLQNVEEFESKKKFDAIGFVFSHFGKVLNNKLYPRLSDMVKSGGHIIFECFSINQAEFRNKSGGPDDIEMLFTTGDIHQLFPDYDVLDLAERIVELDEGIYHQGKASVVNFFGRKK